jgi:hypothetical protein
VLTVVALSLVAAFLFALSAVLQQHAATRQDGASSSALARAVPGVGLLLALVGDPWWLAGWGTNVCGFVVEASALYLGSVSVVQPLVVTQLLFALSLATRGTGRRMPAGAWCAAGSVCAGLAVLLLVHGRPPAQERLDDPRLLGMIVVLVAGAAALVATSASLGAHRATRAALLGVASGFFFALTAVLLKRSAGLLVDAGPAGLVRAWYLYALIASMLCGMVTGQTAFATGPFAAAVTGMNITNPVVSYLLAVLVYGVPAPAGVARLGGVGLAGLLVVAGVAGLARLVPPGHHPGAEALVMASGVAAGQRVGGGAQTDREPDQQHDQSRERREDLVAGLPGDGHQRLAGSVGDVLVDAVPAAGQQVRDDRHHEDQAKQGRDRAAGAA